MSLNLRKNRAAKTLYRTCVIRGPDARIHMLVVSFMTSSFALQMLQPCWEKQCDSIIFSWKPLQTLVQRFTW